MMKWFRLPRGWGLIFVLTLLSCSPKPPKPSGPDQYQKNNSYPQDFVSPVATLIQERNGEPFYLASAFLQDKKLGRLVTAKHFVEEIGGNESDFKIFLNGRVYGGLVAATSTISDLAVISIKGNNFSLADLPDPFSLSEDQLKIGDSVRILGRHPHPLELQADKRLVGIFRSYYGMFWQKKEFVFDDLEAKVNHLALEVKNKDIKGTPQGIGFVSNTYIELMTVEDHLFSFGGLSGGAVVNKKNEVVGVVAHGQEGGPVLIEGHFVVYKPWNILRIVPVEELHKLMSVLLVEEK